MLQERKELQSRDDPTMVMLKRTLLDLSYHWDVLGRRVVVRALVDTEVTGTVPGGGVPEIRDGRCIQHIAIQLMVRRCLCRRWVVNLCELKVQHR